MTKLRIAVDMDEVIADLHGRRLEAYEAEFGVSLSDADLYGKKIYDATPEAHHERLQGYLSEPGFFEGLDVMAGAQDVLHELSKEHEVYIVTAAMEVPMSMPEKYAWLQTHFPFLNPLNFVFCGHKFILATDVLIDDSPRHFETFAGQPILFDALHNRTEERYPRVNTWSEVPALLQSLDLKPRYT